MPAPSRAPLPAHRTEMSPAGTTQVCRTPPWGRLHGRKRTGGDIRPPPVSTCPHHSPPARGGGGPGCPVRSTDLGKPKRPSLTEGRRGNIPERRKAQSEAGGSHMCPAGKAEPSLTAPRPETQEQYCLTVQKCSSSNASGHRGPRHGPEPRGQVRLGLSSQEDVQLLGQYHTGLCATGSVPKYSWEWPLSPRGAGGAGR